MLNRIRQTARVLVRMPSIAAASVLYSGAIYAASLQAGLLEITHPWWVLTAGLLVLLSPLYHAFVISRVSAFAGRRAAALRDVPLEAFGDLVLGEVLVNALVVIAGTLLLLPGIYVGLRTIYYKQSIVLHKTRPAEALRESVRLTSNARKLAELVAFLGIAYCLRLVIYLLPAISGETVWFHPIAVGVTALFLAAVNTYVTLGFEHLVSDTKEAP